MKYANQRRVRIAERATRNKNNLYATVNLDALQEAMRNLNGSSGLLLWLYLDKNAEGYTFDLSQKACEAWGLKRDSYYRAFKELEDKGYLIFGEHEYKFYERSDKRQEDADNQIDGGQGAQSNNIDTTHNTVYETIPDEIYYSLMDKPTDIGNGLVKLANGRIYKRESKKV